MQRFKADVTRHFGINRRTKPYTAVRLHLTSSRLIPILRQQLIQLITAKVTEILPFNEVENKLTDILAAVANTLNGTRTEQRGENAWNGARVFHHVG